MIILTVSDLHCPWQHPDAFDFLADLARRYKPDKVVVLGDEIDAQAFSRFPRNPDMHSPGHEIEAARQALRPLYRLFPRAQVCESNHTIRPWRRASEAGMPGVLLQDVRRVLDAPRAWRWSTRVTVGGILFLHGDGFSGQNAAANAALRHRSRVVIGHIHSFAGIQYLQGWNDRIWGVNAGCLIDPNASAFSYGKLLANRPVIGTAVICDGVPQFVPMGG